MDVITYPEIFLMRSPPHVYQQLMTGAFPQSQAINHFPGKQINSSGLAFC